MPCCFRYSPVVAFAHAGKNRRYTFIECKNDINCMLDLAKICDVVRVWLCHEGILPSIPPLCFCFYCSCLVGSLL